MFSKFNRLITTHPVLSNMMVSGFLFGSGDYLAQTIFTNPITSVPTQKHDKSRTLKAMIYGSIIFAPVCLKWYGLLNKIKIQSPVRTRHAMKAINVNNCYTIIAKVATDQLIFAPLIAVPLYYSIMTVFEFHKNPVDAIKHNLRGNWWETLKTNWLIWPFVQLANFSLIPFQYRLLVVNVLSIGWNCYLSFELNANDLA